MRPDALRTFAGCYQVGGDFETPLVRPSSTCAVVLARTILGLLGLAFAIAGIAVAWTFDRLVGMAILVVGAFLFILPFTGIREDE